MKVFLTSFLALICFAVLIFGNVSWNEKIEDASADNITKPRTADLSSSGQVEKQTSDLVKFISNWPEESAEVFKERLKDDKPFKIVLAGSSEIENDTFSLEKALQENIMETYGNAIELSSITFDVTSTEFLEEGHEQEIADLNADMIIFESLTLKDNGEVIIEDSHENISTIMQATEAANPNISFIVQPPPPLFEANFYPRQVEELKKYAEQSGIVYLDYWNSFPEEGTAERASYFTKSRDSLNAEGYALWTDYLLNYLISQ
ncbi:hypothetical protein IEO70_10250 [Bacillus sp. AGMB 02131]|uniref:SGNH/GDSL hydrolase family protein n=1 Tax=Peribacillus faecalis TaxID=2772559 RepID=A0A927CW68_9BACI|nr:hypothetical protein [Peribacillus faecalis]MBD3108748.1 hypothetical protein [Peribacillus faecalis]